MPFQVSGTRTAYTIGLCLEKAWIVRLECRACDREPVQWGEAELLKLPREATLGQIAFRARCAACGSTSGVLCTRQGRWGERAKNAVGGC
jgi:hypothetical protein